MLFCWPLPPSFFWRGSYLLTGASRISARGARLWSVRMTSAPRQDQTIAPDLWAKLGLLHKIRARSFSRACAMQKRLAKVRRVAPRPAWRFWLCAGRHGGDARRSGDGVETCRSRARVPETATGPLCRFVSIVHPNGGSARPHEAYEAYIDRQVDLKASLCNDELMGW